MHRLFVLTVLLPLAASSPTEDPHHHNRPHRVSTPEGHHPPRTHPNDNEKRDRDPQLQPDFHLNPNWKPDADSLEPISLDGMSPWDDTGRSQMMDRTPFRIYCPARYLDCEKCPRDFRCHRTSSSSSTPWSTPTTRQIADLQGEFNALTGPQLKGLGLLGGKKKEQCLLKTCGVEGSEACGEGAKCVAGHCACSAGRKGKTGSIVRGWSWPESMSVYVDPGVACDVHCKDPFCTEVGRMKSCSGMLRQTSTSSKMASRTGVVPSAAPTEAAGQGELLAVDMPSGHGAVQLPGAALDEGSDYVGGTAVT